MRKRLLWIAPLAIVGFAGFVLAGSWAVMTLWNWLTPGLFGWPTLRLPQALGLLVLCRLLFGGFGMSGGGPSRMRRRMAERWGGLSPEERERMRARIHERFDDSTGGDASV